MVDYTSLYDAFFAAEDEKEAKILNSLIESLQQGSPNPGRFYISGDAGTILSEYSLNTLGRVLRFGEDEEESKKRKKTLDFSKKIRVLGKNRGESRCNTQNPSYGVCTSMGTTQKVGGGSLRVKTMRKNRGKGVKISNTIELESTTKGTTEKALGGDEGVIHPSLDDDEGVPPRTHPFD